MAYYRPSLIRVILSKGYNMGQLGRSSSSECLSYLSTHRAPCLTITSTAGAPSRKSFARSAARMQLRVDQLTGVHGGAMEQETCLGRTGSRRDRRTRHVRPEFGRLKTRSCRWSEGFSQQVQRAANRRSLLSTSTRLVNRSLNWRPIGDFLCW